MTLLGKFIRNNFFQKLNYSTTPKPAIYLNEQVKDDLENETYKPKDHPGRLRLAAFELPPKFVSALKKSVKDFPVKQIVSDGIDMHNYLRGRHIPMEKDSLRVKEREFTKDALEKFGFQRWSDVELNASAKQRHAIQKEIAKVFHERIYSWKAITYDAYKSLVYAFGRSSKEFASICRVFHEITSRDSEFKPRSFFDFGAGVGTGTWAAAEIWKQSLYEYFAVDTSRDMNILSDLILREGIENKHIALKNVYYRQFLPASSEIKYDLILSAYSLIELPDMRKRLETLLTLWNKCDGYLVLIEEGTNAGFSLINEARDFFLSVSKQNEEESAFIFAPCPHHEPCPRMSGDRKTIPCNFEVKYIPISMGTPQPPATHFFTYLIIKKGKRETEGVSIDWPRLIGTPMIRSRHTICRLCTHNGEIEDVAFTKKKHSKLIYRCAKKSKWGDRLPITIENKSEEKINDSNLDNETK